MITYAQAAAAHAKLKIAHAKWKERAPGSATSVEGTCQKCGAVVPAVDLVLTRLPFGRGEVWSCGCKE